MPAVPRASAPATIEIPRVPRQVVREEVLPNGTRIVLNPRPGATTMNIAIGTSAGGLQDPPGKEGAAHLFEHMAFEGTPRRSPEQINKALQHQGGFGNAHTTLYDTVYETSVPTHEARRAAQLFTDMYRNPNSSPYRLKKEQRIVQQEMRYSAGAREDHAWFEQQRLLYGKDPHGRDPLGTVESVQAVRPADVRAWAKQWHTGANTVVLLDGDPKHFPLDVVRSELAKLPKGEPARDPKFGGFRKGAYVETIPHNGDAQANVALYFPNATQVAGSTKMQHTGAVGAVLGSVVRERLNNRLREHGRLTYGVSATRQSDAGEVLAIETELQPRNLRQGIGDIAREMRRLPGTITAEEVARARQMLLNRVSMESEDRSQAGHRQFNGALAGQRRVPGPRAEMNEIAKVTPRAVREAARLFAGSFDNVKVLARGDVTGRADDIMAGMRDAGVTTGFKRAPFPRKRYEELLDTPQGPLVARPAAGASRRRRTP